MWFSQAKPRARPSEIPLGTFQDLPWEKNDKGRFHRLLHLRGIVSELAGRGGVAVFFHRGVKPGWVCVAATDDIGGLLAAAQDDQDILAFEPRGGVYVTWAFVKPEFRDGVAVYLRESLEPEIPSCSLDGARSSSAPPIPVRAPT